MGCAPSGDGERGAGQDRQPSQPMFGAVPRAGPCVSPDAVQLPSVPRWRGRCRNSGACFDCRLSRGSPVWTPGRGQHRPAAPDQAQAVKRAMGETSETISTSSALSFAKARQAVTSASLSWVPWSIPVAGSMTVKRAGHAGIQRYSAERAYERLTQGSHLVALPVERGVKKGCGRAPLTCHLGRLMLAVDACS